MLTTMSGSCANLSVLTRRYEEFCTRLTDDPGQLLANARNCMISDR